jgi:chemotaxis regulatin CheY-phosphate phosphatase CheZ
MNVDEKSEVLMELNNRECRHLLEQVVNWFHSEMGNGNLKHLIRDIEDFLEKTNEKREKT